MIGRTIAHYRVLGKLGEGGMGVVYRAQDTRLGREVAVKALPPEFAADAPRRRRFEQEARAAAALSHPGIATVYALEDVESHLYIIYEYIRGETLRALLLSRRPDLDTVTDIAISVARALAAAHAQGIVHRDLKPENVMCTPEGETKILDFGLARFAPEALSGETASLRATQPGSLVGTVCYMAPEQLEGKEVDFRSDIFAFGVLLYELATGTHPFEGSSHASRIARILTAEPARLGQVNALAPAELDRIVRKCLRKRREERYQSTRDLVVDLENLKRETGERRASGVGQPQLEEAEPVEPSLLRRAFAFVGRTPRQWWELNHACASLFFPAITVFFAWEARGWWSKGSPNPTLVIFFLTLANAIAFFTLRWYLLVTAALSPKELPKEVRRFSPVIQWVYAFLMYWCASLAVIGAVGGHLVGAAILAGLAVAGALIALLVEPAIDRAAFPQAFAETDSAEEPASRARKQKFANIAGLQFSYLLLLAAPLVLPGDKLAYLRGKPASVQAGWVLLAAVLIAGIVVLVLSAADLMRAETEALLRFRRRFPLYLVFDVVAIGIWVALSIRESLPSLPCS